MEQRLKERLTGAAILVALIVLIVPELFHGHLSERASRTASSSEGPPLRSYLIDLGGGRSAPMQVGNSAARGLPAPGTVTATAEPIAAAAPTAASPSVPVPTAASAGVAAVPVRAAPAPPAGTAQHTGASTTIALAPAPVKTVAHLPAGSAHGRAAADWTVQLGLYARRANAEHMVQVAHAKGFAASLVKPDARGRYRVRVAGLTTRAAALRLAARLRAAGLPAAAVGPR